MKNNEELVNDVLQKFAQLKEKRKPWETVWDIISDFVSPNIGARKIDDKQATIYGENQFDGTASSAAMLLADGLMGYITTPTGRWYKMAFEKPALKNNEKGTEWLQAGEEVYGTIYGKSNFYNSMSKIFHTGVSYGTATLYIEDDVEENAANFTAINPREVYIESNHKGRVDTVFRNYKQSAKNIVKRWKGSLPEGFEKQAKEKPYEQHKIIHAVFPREDRDMYKIDKFNKKYASIYILEGYGHLLSEGGYDTMPYVVWRYFVNSDEDYGRSPAWFALADIKQSQQVARTLMKAAHRAVSPPIQAPMELQGILDLDPDGMNWYMDPNRPITEIATAMNYPIGKDQQELIKKAIETHFRVEFFLMWNSMMGQQGQRTATEVMEMSGERAAVLAPMVNQIDSELLNPIFERLFVMASRNGWLPEPPQELADYSGEEIKVEYVGPLAQAVKKHWNTQQINQTLIQYVSLFQVWPELRHRIDPKEMGRYLLENGGFPEKLIVDDALYDQAIEAEKQAQAAAMQQQDGLAQAEVFSKLNQSVQKNSPAEAML